MIYVKWAIAIIAAVVAYVLAKWYWEAWPMRLAIVLTFCLAGVRDLIIYIRTKKDSGLGGAILYGYLAVLAAVALLNPD